MAFAIEFFLRRIAQGMVIVLLAAFVIFTLLRVAPGDPIRIILGPMTPAAVLEQKAEELGLRDPIPTQFIRFAGQILAGDFGHSYIRGVQGGSTGGSQDAAEMSPEQRAPVLSLIGAALPNTLALAATGTLMAVMFAFPIGILAGLSPGRWPDRLGLYLSSILVSLPNIWIGIVLIYLLSARSGLLPAIGFHDWRYLIIPAMVIAIELSPVMIRNIAVAVTSNMREGWFEMGQIRGIHRAQMIVRHVFRNASVPLLNVFGAQMIGMLLGGLFVVEYIFSFPGIGLLTINAVYQRDFPIIQAIAILASTALVVVNMLVDFGCTLIDRRLKF